MKSLNYEHLPIPADVAPLDASAAPSHPLTLTIPDVQRRTGISRSEIYRLLAAGKLRAVKSGTRTLVLWESVVGYVASLPAAMFTASVGRSR